MSASVLICGVSVAFSNDMTGRKMTQLHFPVVQSINWFELSQNASCIRMTSCSILLLSVLKKTYRKIPLYCCLVILEELASLCHLCLCRCLWNVSHSEAYYTSSLFRGSERVIVSVWVWETTKLRVKANKINPSSINMILAFPKHIEDLAWFKAYPGDLNGIASYKFIIPSTKWRKRTKAANCWHHAINRT